MVLHGHDQRTRLWITQQPIGGTVFFPMVIDEMELMKLQMDLIGIELVHQSDFFI